MSTLDAAEAVHAKLVAAIRSGDLPAVGPGRAGLTTADLAGLFNSQVSSRQLDRLSRRLQARGEGFYTIGSSGHEGNAALARAARVPDMAFLHYRDAATDAATFIRSATLRPGGRVHWAPFLANPVGVGSATAPGHTLAGSWQ